MEMRLYESWLLKAYSICLTDKSNFIYIDRVSLMRQIQHMTNWESLTSVKEWYFQQLIEFYISIYLSSINHISIIYQLIYLLMYVSMTCYAPRNEIETDIQI